MRDSTPITDANRPPFVIPFCASCDKGVESFTTYPDTSDPAMFLIEASCHGKTQGIRMGRYQAEFMNRQGKKLIVFQRRQGFDAVR